VGNLIFGKKEGRKKEMEIQGKKGKSMPREAERRAQQQDPDEFLKKAKRLAMNVYNTDAMHSSYPPITEDQLFVVWFTKTLQNWKAMVSTTVPLDSAYFEVTHNGATEETYVDMYYKHSNTVFNRLN
jgi:hypothetical protein